MSNEQQPTDPSAPAVETSEPQAAAPAAPESQVATETPAGEATESPAKPSTAKTSTAKPSIAGSGPLAARGLGVSKPASPTVTTEQLDVADSKGKPGKGKKKAPKPRLGGQRDGQKSETASAKAAKPTRIAVPSLRDDLSDDLQALLDAELAGADVDSMLGGSAGMPDRKEPLEDGARIQAKVLKIHNENVYLALGGPDEGVVAFEQFTEAEPEIGSFIEVAVRGRSAADGLYQCSLPGATIAVDDWSDLEEGSVIEAIITGSNSGGLECKVGGVRGFIPISQIAEYRVEDTTEFVDQRFVCLVAEANERRGNLVLSRRAILEREREQRRAEQLETIAVGDTMQGTVGTIKDFGAFVDLGGVEGLIHISKLSWERVKHPSDVLETGQKVEVKIDAINKETGKISLSYRDLLENPWDAAEAEFAAGSIHTGTVTKIATFGCFVRLTAGVEGLVHVSEIDHKRVSKVDAVVKPDQVVEVKVLSFDRQSQKISLSIKQAKQIADADVKPVQEEIDEPPREVAIKPMHDGPLKGGNNRPSGGEQFGLRW